MELTLTVGLVGRGRPMVLRDTPGWGSGCYRHGRDARGSAEVPADARLPQAVREPGGLSEAECHLPT